MQFNAAFSNQTKLGGGAWVLFFVAVEHFEPAVECRHTDEVGAAVIFLSTPAGTKRIVSVSKCLVAHVPAALCIQCYEFLEQ